ncbi:hypothetical protein AX16_007191 [Volvariella volvacea WC 439]|nr:hypothetical protein AX16_007191 [Volvariella volvacea WC 439]
MFSSSVRATLLALAFGAAHVAASQGLSLSVAGSSSFVDVDNLKVVATITNTGDETLKILNDPYSPLSTLPTETFTVTDASGAAPEFIGVKAKFVPSVAAEIEGAYTILAPGESVSVEHDLSQAYNLTNTGVGDYTFEANNRFYIVGADNHVSTVYADGEVHTARVSGRLAAARRDEGLTKRATFVGCSSSQQSLINTAASSATTYATNSYNYLNANTAATTRYTTWFGAFTSSRRSTVLSHFNAIRGNNFNSFTWDCTCTDSGTYAYVYPSQFGRVYFCGAFWNAPNTGTDSKAGTIVHEASHFTSNGGTNDYAYGQSACRSLASSNPDRAVMNADSHEYFAENNPALS